MIENALTYLQSRIKKNKGIGIIAEQSLVQHVSTFGMEMLSGCWLMKNGRDKFAIFCSHVSNESEKEKMSPIYNLLNKCQYQVINSIVDDRNHWRHYYYQNGENHPLGGDEPFIHWGGHSNYQFIGEDWGEDIRQKFTETFSNQQSVYSLMAKQTFYYSYIKERLHKPTSEIYDIDGFILKDKEIFPVEVKEKYPSRSGLFGIDVGRIILLARLGILNNINPLYVIRHVDADSREFCEWKWTNLQNILTYCDLNIIEGGRSMTGGSTQTLLLPAETFMTREESFSLSL